MSKSPFVTISPHSTAQVAVNDESTGTVIVSVMVITSGAGQGGVAQPVSINADRIDKYRHIGINLFRGSTMELHFLGWGILNALWVIATLLMILNEGPLVLTGMCIAVVLVSLARMVKVSST